MRQSALNFILPVACWIAPLFAPSVSLAQNVPVYLNLQSRFPSGEFQRSVLESKTREVQYQRWLRVRTSDKKYGWLPEDHSLTALKLVDQVSFVRDTPSRIRPQMEGVFTRPVIKQGTKALVLQVQGSWMKVQPLPIGQHHEAWTLSENLRAEVDAGPSRAFIHTSTELQAAPQAFARKLGRVKEESLVHLIRETPEWLEVRSAAGFGFIPRNTAWTARELGITGARPSSSHVALRSNPLPFSETLRTLPLSAKLSIAGSKNLRWGKANVRDVGDMWWPIEDQAAEAPSKKLASLSSQVKVVLGTDAIFDRKIFDLATSKTAPALQFISADGVFKTTDGEKWTKLPEFKSENHPIAVAKSGTVFVGAKLSEDNGDSFREWIRWDTLVSSLEVDGEVSARKLRIVEIKPQDTRGKRVVLRLDVGQAKNVSVITEDQGLSWRLL